MSMFSLAAQSGLILLREGLEALLVISALAAFLHRAGAGEKRKVLYLGAGFAVLASIAGAIVFEIFLGGAHDDRVEAVVMLVAAALMFYVSGWLYLKQDPRAWQAGLRDIADRALSAGTTLSLGAIAFLAVFREGAETILFLHALAVSAGGWNAGFWIGLACAALGLAAIWVGIDAFAARLPLKPLFLATSAFLFVMGLRFVGGAIQELQELQLLAYTESPVAGLMDALGFNPTVEALAVEGMLVALAVAGAVFARAKARRATLAAAE